MSDLVPRELGSVRFDPFKSLWLWGMLVPGVVAGIPACTRANVSLSLVLTFVTLCAGHSVGLHRGVIHATYRAGPVVRGALAYLFVLGGLGGPLSWAKLHADRDYWQNRADCPRYFAYEHSIARDFWWNLHLRFIRTDDRALSRLPAGTLDDPWLRFLERTWPLHMLALALVLFATLGSGAVAVCFCARNAAGILGHWFVGYCSHKWGARPFEIPGAKETGTNNWALGVLSFGEGFHNNHHAHPGSARIGLCAHEIDLGWFVVRALAALGWINDVRAAAPPTGLRVAADRR